VSKISKQLVKRIFEHKPTSFLGEDLWGGRRDVFYCPKHCFSRYKNTVTQFPFNTELARK